MGINLCIQHRRQVFEQKPMSLRRRIFDLLINIANSYYTTRLTFQRYFVTTILSRFKNIFEDSNNTASLITPEILFKNRLYYQ